MKKLLLAILLLPFMAEAQDFGGGSFRGNFQIEAQTYKEDTLIGAEKVDEQIRANSYFNFIYTLGQFEIGARYEAYLKPLLSFDPRLGEQSGFAYRYAMYRSDFIDITAGDFYEQFGSGLIFRAYEERALGLDNAVDGLRIKVRPSNGVEVTGLIGRQRNFWEKSEGILRGGDINAILNDIFTALPSDLQLRVGGSVISKYEEDNNTRLNLPQNVLAYSARAGVGGSFYSIDAEYGYKFNDPNATNLFMFNPGSGLIISGNYFTKGIGLALSAHRIDNMNFRSERNAVGNELFINFIPPLTKQHTFRLATLYPAATQLNNEAGVQAELTFDLPKETWWGGKYGTDFSVNYSQTNKIDTTHINPFKYESNFFDISDQVYFRDFSVEMTRKVSKELKIIADYIYTQFDRDVMENQGALEFGIVRAHAAILDLTYSFRPKHAVRLELQHLWAKQDSLQEIPDNRNGNWAMGLIEYTISPHWFFTILDEYNYGNQFEEKQLHYPTGSIAYITGATRLQLSYGKQRGGTMCVGGICRTVPASNGFYLSISSSF